MPKLSKTEQARRKDIKASGVAQEALDKLAGIDARNGSSSEAFTVHGYSLSHVLKLAIAEEARIVAELLSRPSKDVVSAILDVAAVKTKRGIDEYVPKGEPVKDPVVVVE